MKIPVSKIPRIGTDSRNALLAAESEKWNMSTRHMDVRYKWIKEKVCNRELILYWVDTENMKTDGLTKALNPTKQAYFVQLLGLTEVGMKKQDGNKAGMATEQESKEKSNPEASLAGTAVHHA
jgi:hypothetical protein